MSIFNNVVGIVLGMKSQCDFWELERKATTDRRYGTNDRHQ